jgi:hypothetical protein
MDSKTKCIRFPSGIALPTTGNNNSESEGIGEFETLIELFKTNSNDTILLNLKTVETVFNVFNNNNVTPYNFWLYNMEFNSKAGIVIKQYLQETLWLFNEKNTIKDLKGFRRISPKLFADICAMPLTKTQYAVPPTSLTVNKKLSSSYPRISTEELIGRWCSYEGGVMDMLWTFRALFGHGQ